MDEADAMRKAFEQDYPLDSKFWLAKKEDGSYYNDEIQDAWLQFSKGWNRHKTFLIQGL